MKNTFSTTAAVLSCLATTVASRAFAQDWPQWRGANRDGKAVGFNAPKTWPKELTQKWKVAVGEGVATPSLVGGKLYVFSRQDGNEIIRCLEAATGKELWLERYDSLGASGAASSFSGPRSSPAVADGKVVTLGVRGILSCFDAATGKKLWSKDDFQAHPRFHPSSSPIIVNGLCIAQLGGESNGAIVAYDLTTGEQKWKWTGPSPAYASPALLTAGGTKLIVAQTETKMVALNAADGKLAWETSPAPQGDGGGGGGGRGGRGGGRDYKAATPIVDGQTIIAAGRGTKALKLEKTGDGFAAKELWNNAESSVQFNTPVLKNGFIYGLTPGNELFCLNAQDGQKAWIAPLALAGESGTPGGGRPPGGGPPGGPPAAGAPSTPPPGAPPGGPPGEGPPGGGRGGRGRGGFGGGSGYGSIVDAGSVLLALTPASQLIAFQPSDKVYTELARIKVADSPTHAYPVVSGNRIFIKDQSSVTLWTVE